MQAPVSISQSASRFTYPWMFGRKIDLFFFFLPALFAMGVVALLTMPQIQHSIFWLNLLVLVFGAGGFHWGGTWFMYFDKKNMEHYISSPKKRLIFLAAPPVILALSILGAFASPAMMMFITIAWAVQHLVQQNVGILLLYHNQKRNEAIVDRKIEVRTMHSGGYLFTTMFFFRTIMHDTSSIKYAVVIGAMSIWFLWSVADYLTRTYRMVREGKVINVPAFGFWAISILSFLPLGFWGHGFDQDLLIPATMHWFQYIGLNYELVKTKYAEAAQRGQNLLPHPLAGFFVLSVALCGLSLALGLGKGMYMASGAGGNVLVTVMTGVLTGLAYIHYFLDAFIWRFREEFNRAAILPYLLDYRKKSVAVGE